ncbi:hypothetical protein ACFOQM_23440 [Paenibacillus sp. GCM10012307]|uniref:Uncharacterized protein n=1 Tax=Paenibacillus roseus TaxID=2798579 RepID=A0A934MSQ4_9BACL|nr:hypothetical protein [Paenibacillus roseus]MBJ6364178.1 hypothetical protein [Paenibacillus roseus]
MVALITGTSDTRAWAKGIAKAAPGDVFNEHIGKAIALHRALGLPVPSEYLNAPEPEGFRVDDVVTNRDGVYADVRFTSTLLHRLPGYDGVTIKGVYCGDAWRHSYSHGWVGENQIRVVDDSARYSAVGNEVSA